MNNDNQLTASSIQKALETRDFLSLRQSFKEMEYAYIAEVLSLLELSEAVVVFRLIPRAKHSGLFSHMPFDLQVGLVQELPDVLVVSFLNELEPDNRTRFLEDLDEKLRDKLLFKLDPKERQVAWQLLSYPENSVGRWMTPDLMTLNGSMRISQALNYIHWNTSLPVEYLNYLFVHDDKGCLIGEVNLASLVVCDPPTKLVSDVMHKTKVWLRPEQDQEEAVEIFRKYNRYYIPVVDESDKILGLVSADDVFDLAEEAATEDIQQFGGHEPLEGSYFHTPWLMMFKKRAGWLAFLFVSGFISGQAIRSYEGTLAKWSFLVFFLPIITSAGGNSGTQAASLIIRGLAINELSARDAAKVLAREIGIGFALGFILASIGFVFALLWGLSHQACLVIFIAVIAVVIFGVIAGSMLPFVFRSMGLDPAVVSSPFISTLVDVTGIMILFNVAILISRFFGLH